MVDLSGKYLERFLRYMFICKYDFFFFFGPSKLLVLQDLQAAKLGPNLVAVVGRRE